MKTTFKRFEKKYMISKKEYDQLLQRISTYLAKDEYAMYTVSNIYYDTDNYSIIRNSIEKPVYKEKLRLRSYGIVGDDDKVFFELKKKYKKEVFKRRVVMSHKDFKEYQLKEKVDPNRNDNQILSEIEYFTELTKCKPSLYLAYEREAFKGREDSSLRITFDSNIRFRTSDLDLSSSDYGQNIFKDKLYLMEIKISGAFPLWLSKELNDLKIYPRSFSKYGYIYTNFLNKEEESKSTAHIFTDFFLKSKVNYKMVMPHV